jgi:carbonic anhydrase
MKSLTELLSRNRAWSEKIRRQDPTFFSDLSAQQLPQFFWIGCSDSRVPANQIVDMMPGDVFVHRNVANVVVHTDLNCLSTLQYAVDVLKVRDVIVCGHYGCGGVLAALRGSKFGLIDNWLRHVADVRDLHRVKLETMASEEERHDRLCEWNVIEQVLHVSQTTVMQDAWNRGQEVAVHGWIYSLKNGLIRDLETTITNFGEALDIYRDASTVARRTVAE